MKVLVCGDRNWKDEEIIEKELKKLLSDTIIIHGNCRGADKMAGVIAKILGIKVEIYPADWERYGKGAGIIRNQQT